MIVSASSYCTKNIKDKCIFPLTRNTRSQFLKGLLSVRQWCQWGRKLLVKDGRRTRFWVDLWIGECPLSVEFNQLFKFCRDPNISVNEVCSNGVVHIEFRRSLNDEEMDEWWRLVELVGSTILTLGEDEMRCILEKKDVYTTRSLYRVMTFGGVKDRLMMKIWKCKNLLKIKFFLWMAYNDRIQSAVQLKKRKWSGPEECKLFGEKETVHHIIFVCPVATFIKELCGLLHTPTSCAELAELVK